MKIYNYTVLAVLLMALFFVAGMDTSSSFVFAKMGLANIADVQTSTFWIALAAVFSVATLGAAAIGSIIGISPTFAIKAIYVMSPLTLLVLDFISILTKLFSYGVGWTYWIAFILMTPLIAGYAIALIEFWEGRD